MNKEYPLVTIGMPTYNRAAGYLKQALESALNQTYPHIEIVVSDNCSTDNTEEVVKSFDDPRIHYFKQSKNVGLINNVNFCLRQAKGNYFMQLHDDDLIDHDFIESCMKSAHFSKDMGVIRTGSRVIDSHNNTTQESLNGAVGLSTNEFFRSWFNHKTSIYLCCTLYNTEKLKEAGGFHQSLLDDVIAIAQLSKFGRVDVREIKASFRKHGDELTFTSDIRDWCKDSLRVLDILTNLVRDEEKRTFRQEGVRYFSNMNYNFASKIESPINRFVTYFEIYKFFGFRYAPSAVRKILFYINPLSLLRRMMGKNSNAIYAFNVKTAARYIHRFKSCVLNPPGYWRTIEYELVLNEGKFKKNDLILDIGSPKPLALYLAKVTGAQVTSTDVDDNFMEEMTFLRQFERIPEERLHLKVEDRRNLSFDNEQFNKIYSISFLNHIPDEGDTECMKEIARVLKKDGKCILAVPFSPSPKVQYKNKKERNRTKHYSRAESGNVFFQRRYSEQELYDRIINPSGLTLEKLQFIGEKVLVDSEKELVDVLPRWTSPIEPFLSKIFITRPVDSWKRLKKPLCAFIVLRKE